MPLLVLLLALATPPVDDRALYERACDQVAAAYDTTRGGFVTKDGVPSEDAIELALILGREPGPGEWKARALGTVAWSRGLKDSIGGGFFTSPAEVTPSHARFYKQADVNARRLENLISIWKLTSDVAYRRDAAGVVDFMGRVLLDGRGGFLPSQGSAFELVPEANGVAIHAWLEWAAATTDASKRDFALKSLDRVWSECWVSDLGLVRRGMLDQEGPPRLVDQVEMGRALVLSARLATRPADAQHARLLGDLLLERFQDPERGEFSSQCGPTKKGGIKRSGMNSAENARAARFLCELATLTGEPKYREGARRAWSVRAPKLEDLRLDAAGWALAIHAAIEPALPDAPQWPRVAEAAPAPTRVEIFKPRRR